MTDDEPQNLAAEYVLGVLDAVERREAERRLASEPGFAAEVAYWEARLGPLADQLPEVAPPARVWRGIEWTLAGGPQPGLWHSLPFWRAFGLGSLGIAAAAIAALFIVAPPAQKPMFATLQQGAGPAAFVVGVDPSHGQVYVVPASYSRDVQRVAELWLIAPGQRPKSLGLLDPAKPVTLTVPEALRGSVTPDSTLAVTLEPPGGAPGGVATGPVVAQGKFTGL
jgi:anti-sigma-K factor RskA